MGSVTGPTTEQHRRMHLYWRRARVADRGDRLALTGAIVGRPLATSDELTREEATAVLRYLRRLDDTNTLAGKAAAWLAEHGRTAGAA